MRFGARASALSKFLLSSTLLLGAAAHAQTAWTVTNFTDTSFATLETGGGFGPGVGSGNAGDLRYVLFQAMATGGANTITFPGCTTTSPCTIVLGAPLPPIFETSNISSFSLTIDGGTEGAVILDGNSSGTNTTSGALTTNRVFFVDNVAVTLKNLVIQNATAQGGAGGAGGAGGGGGAGFGAGLFVNQSTAVVNVQNTSFLNMGATGGAGGSGNNIGFPGGGGGLAYPGGNNAGNVAGSGGGVSGAGSSGSQYVGANGGAGGGGGAVGSNLNATNGSGGSGYADNAGGQSGTRSMFSGAGGAGGFGGGGGAGSTSNNGGAGGFGGGGAGVFNPGQGSAGSGGFGGGGGGTDGGTAGSSAPAVGGIQGGTGGYYGGGGGAAAGPAIFVVNGSVTLYNTTGSGFTATAGAAGGSGDGSTAGTSSAVPVFNYGGKVNGSTSVGPVYNAFTVTEPVGATSATQTATLTFTTAVTSSNTFTTNVLTQGAPNLDFKLVSGGTCASGTAYAVGATCTVEYSFTPTSPGIRYGGITLVSSGSVVASTFLSGIGTGPQVVFNAPLTPSKLGGGFFTPYGVAVDGSGNVYFADQGQSAVKVMANTCTSSSCISTLGGGFFFPTGVAVDGSGNVYVSDNNNNAVKVMANTCTSSSCVSTLGGGFNAPFGVAVDGSGNVYVADTNNNAVKVMATTCTSSTCVTTLGGGFSRPTGVAVDGSGNVYVADNNNNAVKVMANTCTSSSCVSTLGGGFNNPYDVAVDGSGNVYVADTNNSAVKVMPNTCTSSTCVTTLGNGFSGPLGVAVDGSGNVYVSDNGNIAVKVMARATPPTVAFSHTTTDGTTDTTDGTTTVTLQNIGNAALSLLIPGSGLTNPTTPHDFTFTTTGGSACPSLTSSASTTGTLAASASCNIPLTFTPVSPANGALSESLTLTDTNLNASAATQTITLTGTAFLPLTPTVTVSSGGIAYGTASTTLSASVAFLGLTVPSGSFTFQVDSGTVVTGSCTGLSSPLSCSGSYNTSTLSVGGHTITATIAADSNFTTGSGTNTLSVSADPVSTANSTVAVSPSPVVAGSSVTVTATLKDSSGNAISGATGSFSSTSTTATFGTPSVTGNVITVSMTDTAVETAPITVTLGGNASGTLTGSAQFVTPAYAVTVATDVASGNGTAANCVDPNVSTSGNGNCSLRDAIAAANALSGVTTNIFFSLPYPSTILIAQHGGITISKNVNLNGPGPIQLTLEGGTTPLSSSNNEILQISNGNVSVAGLTLANGFADGFSGGAIGDSGSGTLTVTGSTFSGNIAAFGGGAILANSTLTVSNSTFSGNSANAIGGANGGAIYAISTLTVSNSTFSGNSANANGGANGGAIYAISTLTVSNSTFSGNSANATLGGGYGGAIHANSTLTVSNSIFSGDSAPNGSGIYANNGGTVTNIVYNGDTFRGVTPTASLNADPKLSALGNYGGDTQTFLPLPGSPAICAGTQPMLNGNALTTDQRGVAISGARYGQSACYDVGAVQTEYALSFTTSPGNTQVGSSLSPTPLVTLSEDGAGLTAGSASLVVSAATGTLSGTTTQSTSTTSLTAGQASFPGLSISPTETGETLTATLALTSSINLSAQSSSFNVLANPVSAANSSVNAAPNPAVAGSNVTVTVTVKDSSNNAINGATASFSSTSTTASFGTPSVSGNVITVSMTDTAVETAPITITLGGTLTGSAQFVAPAYVVTVATDPSSGNGTAANCVDPNISSSGNTNCSLRDAVAAANALTGVTTNIGFSGAAVGTAGSPAVILIAQQGGITISKNVNLNGPGANLLTLEGGIAPYNGTTQTANNRILQISGGNVNITGLTFANAYSGSAGSGAAINLYGSGGPLTVSNSVFSGNVATLNGGAINTSSSLRVSGSTFSSNSATQNGGAIYTLNSLTVSNSTFSGNKTAATGGAIYQDIFNVGSLALSNNTFSGNQASTVGGAIYTDQATFTINDNIFSGDSAPSDSGIFNNTGSGTASHNVFSGDTVSGVTPTNSISANPNLSALGNYGGPTQTFLPLPGSSAICAGTQPSLNGTPLTTDQRGVTISSTRYGQTGCYDVGAVQTEYSLGSTFTTQPPSFVAPGVAISPSPAVTVTENGLGVSGATVTMSAANGTVGGTTSATSAASTGLTTFSNLTITGALPGDDLVATLTLNSVPSPAIALALTSSTFSSMSVSAPSTLTGQVGVVYSQSVSAAHGTAPYAYSITHGPLPAGLALSSSSGLISGTPTAGGSFSITVTATDSNGATSSASFTLVISAATIVVSPTALPTLTVGTAPTISFSASGGTASYSYSLGASSLPAGLTLNTSTGAVTGTPTTAGAYSFTITATDSSTGTGPYSGSQSYSGTVGTGSATVSFTSSTLSQTYTGSPLAVTATTNPTGLALTYSYVGTGSTTYGPSATPPTHAGTYNVTATINNSNYTGSAGPTAFTISKATPTITTAPTASSITYGATLSTSTLSGGVASTAGTFAWTNGATVPGAGTASYSVTFTPTDTTDYNTATVNVSLTVNQASQTITFTQPTTPVLFGVAPITLSATGGASGNPVTFSIVSGPGTVSGSTLTITGVGTVVVAANQAGNANYSAAAQVTRSVVVNASSQTITFAPPSPVTYGVAPITLTATGGPAGTPVTFTLVSGPATLSGSVLSITGAGTVSITATQAAGNGYSAATPVTASIVVNKATPAVPTPTSSVNPVLLQNAVTFTATVSSSVSTPTGTVSFYDNTPGAALGVGTLTAGVATFTTSALSAGTHSITAIYSGDANFVTVTSAAVSQSVQDFSLNISSSSSVTSVTIAPGGTANYTFAVTPTGSTIFPAAVTLSVSGLPAGATYTLTPAGIAAGAGATNFVLTITVPQQLVQLEHRNDIGKGLGTVALALLLLPFSRRIRKRARSLSRVGLTVLLILAGAGAAMGLSGCGFSSGFFGSAQKSYAVTVTGTSGTLSHSATVTLTVE